MLGLILLGTGALGFLTGAGGMYYFMFPVIVPPSSSFGKSFFSLSPPGVWDDDTRSGSSQGNLFTYGGMQVIAGYMFNMTVAATGLDKNASTNYYQYYMPSQTLYQVDQASPGPLGPNAGYWFAGLMAAGVVLEVLGL